MADSRPPKRLRRRDRTRRAGGGGAPIAMPFDAARRGFVMGEGGFMLVLEDEESASARGARVLAEVLGTSSSASSVAINAWPEDDVALVRAMRLAIEDAGITPDDVDVGVRGGERDGPAGSASRRRASARCSAGATCR